VTNKRSIQNEYTLDFASWTAMVWLIALVLGHGMADQRSLQPVEEAKQNAHSVSRFELTITI